MAVKIRLRRMGAKKSPFYRIVVADSRFPRDGRFIEELGYYNPLTEPVTIKVDLEKVEKWISNGAQPTETVKRLLREARRNTPEIEPEAEKEEPEAEKEEVKEDKE